MPHLGSFGEQQEDIDPITFDYFGVTMRSNPSLSELDFMDFLELVGKEEFDPIDALHMVKGFARTCLHPEDFEAFWSSAKAHGQRTEAVFKVLQAVVEASADRPTERPSDSSDGPPSTVASSERDVFSAALADPRLASRPDLRVVVERAAAEAAAG